MKWKKHSVEKQTLRAGCSRAEPKIFALPQTPFLVVRDSQNLITGDGQYLYLQTQFSVDRCTQFRVIVVTDPPTHTPAQSPTDRTDYNTHCAAASAQCNEIDITIERLGMVSITSDDRWQT